MKIVAFALIFFFFSLALANNEVDDDLHHHASQLVLKGRVNCVDCDRASDLSGVQVSAKCDKVKKLSITYTREDGTFETYLPSDNNHPKLLTTPLNCKAKIMGGPHQLYASTKDSIISVAKSKDLSHYETLKPLDFYESCPLKAKCGDEDAGFESSKTVDLPLPREWGLAPTSYYVPFLPIIGIP